MEPKAVNFYVKNFDQSKEFVDSVSSSFCAAKWLQVSLHLTNGKTHSCYHPPIHNIPLEELPSNPSRLHNTPQKFQERKMMLEGQRPAGCEYCWKIEDTGHISDRYYRSSETWASDKLELISKQSHDADVNPTYVEVNFNQSCNFKCSYCSPHLSSEWQSEIEKFGPYVFDDQKHNDIKKLTELKLMPVKQSSKDNPYVQAFWKWWPELYKELKVFRMTGGEPLMDANTFKVLDYVKEHPNKNLELSITSNMCPPRQELWDKFLEKIKALDSVDYDVECYVPDPKNGSDWQTWQHYVIGKAAKDYHGSELPSIEREDIPQTFPKIGHALEDGSFTYLYKYQDKGCKHFTLYVSIDSTGKHAEYIRNGLNYDQLIKNVQQFLSETTNTSVSFINTFNILSIPNFKEFLKVILMLRRKFQNKDFQRIWFDIPLLRKPEWMSPFNASDEDITHLKEILSWMEEQHDDDRFINTRLGFKKYEVEKVKRNIEVIEKNKYSGDTLSKNKRDFVTFFTEHDRRRGTNFEKTFPTIADRYR